MKVCSECKKERGINLFLKKKDINICEYCRYKCEHGKQCKSRCKECLGHSIYKNKCSRCRKYFQSTDKLQTCLKCRYYSNCPHGVRIKKKCKKWSSIITRIFNYFIKTIPFKFRIHFFINIIY